MKYYKQQDKIVVDDIEQFNPEHILECGQVFRYKKTNECYTICSLDKFAKIVPKFENQNPNCNQKKLIGYEIITKDVDYFENYFDLKTDYTLIKQNALKIFENNSISVNKDFLKLAIDFGFGIRILKQNYLEAIISFVISQNNNISRIQSLIEKLCSSYGTKIDDYFAFPTLNQLLKITKQDFEDMGMGYRSQYLINTIQYLSNFDFDNFSILTLEEKEKSILSIKGIGQKVCDCILLFGFYQMKVFPVDTWIEKVYVEYFSNLQNNKILQKNEKNTEKLLKNIKKNQKNEKNQSKNEKLKNYDRLKIRNYLVNIFDNYSGFAQQYLFYYQRSKQD